MDYAHLGRSGLLASRVAMGTMNFGDATSFQVMDTAVEQGINLFDSADVYGGPHRVGVASSVQYQPPSRRRPRRRRLRSATGQPRQLRARNETQSAHRSRAQRSQHSQH
jgi:diketogulonate reductase-like aldo/keto reductase